VNWSYIPASLDKPAEDTDSGTAFDDLKAFEVCVKQRTVDEERPAKPSAVGLPVLWDPQVAPNLGPVVSVLSVLVDESSVRFSRRHGQERSGWDEFVVPLDHHQIQVAIVDLKGAPGGEVVQPLLNDVPWPAKSTDAFIPQELVQSAAAELPTPLRQVREVT